MLVHKTPGGVGVGEGAGAAGGGDGYSQRTPQSVQSCPIGQLTQPEYSAPAPPSLHKPLFALVCPFGL